MRRQDTPERTASPCRWRPYDLREMPSIFSKEFCGVCDFQGEGFILFGRSGCLRDFDEDQRTRVWFGESGAVMPGMRYTSANRALAGDAGMPCRKSAIQAQTEKGAGYEM